MGFEQIRVKEQEITQQAELVRALKCGRRDKHVIDQEVEKLLELKKELQELEFGNTGKIYVAKHITYTNVNAFSVHLRNVEKYIEEQKGI